VGGAAEDAKESTHTLSTNALNLPAIVAKNIA
jgi:hypothetical protein